MADVGAFFDSVFVSVDPRGLAPGVYTGTVFVSFGPTFSPPSLDVPVSLTVTAAPAISLSVITGGVSLVAGGLAQSLDASLSRTNYSGNVTLGLSGLPVGVSGNITQPGTGSSGSVSLQASTTAGAVSNRTVTVTASGSGVSSTTTTFSLSVVSEPRLTLIGGQLYFAQAVAANPSAQTFQVQNGGSGSLGWTATASSNAGGSWLAVSPTSGTAPSTVTVRVNTANLVAGSYSGSVTVSAVASPGAVGSPQTIPVSLRVGPAPTVPAGGIVNGASFSRAGNVSPGSLVSLFGTNLGFGTVSSGTLPLPTALAGATVLVNGNPAALFFVSSGQINFQVPWEFLGQTGASVMVRFGDLASPPTGLAISGVSPGIFTLNQQGTGQAAVLISATGELAGPSGTIPGLTTRPARRGEFISIFCTGLGDVSNRPPNGHPALTSPLSTTKGTPSVTFGGITAVVSFSGLAPGFVGLYQINTQVPSNAPTGNSVTLSVSVGGVTASPVTIAVQ